jgi:hypothetical protein
MLCSLQSWGQTWVTISLNPRVRADFPSQPEIQKAGNVKIFQILDSAYIINVATNDMTQNEKFKVRPEQIGVFYKGVIKGALDAATNSKLLDEKKIEIDGLEAREIKYTKDFNGMIGMHVTKRILLLDKVIFIFDVWDLTGKGQEALTEKLFKSISVTP